MANWQKHLAAIVAGGFLTLSVSGVWAAPVELSLNDSIALALQNNPAIKVAEADKDAASWKIKEAKTSKSPMLSFDHTSARASYDGGTKVVPDGNGGARSFDFSSGIANNYSNNVTLSLPLYTGGKAEGVIEQAKLGYESADYSVAKTKQQIKLDATTAYYNVLQTRNLVTVADESVNSLTAHLKNVQAHYDVGTVAKSDLLRSEVELANAQQYLIKAQNAADLAVANMNNVIGLPLGSELALKEELQYQKYEITLEDSIDYALAHRPEAAQAAIGVEAAKEGRNIAKSGYRPTLGLAAANSWDDDDFPGFENDNWSVGLKANFNIFDSGLTKSKVEQADASIAKAEQQAKQVTDGIQLEVRQAYLNMQEAEKRIDTTKVAVDKAQEDFKIAQVRYGAGVGTNIDVLDAQVALTQAKTNYIQALYDFNTSKAELEKAMGATVE